MMKKWKGRVTLAWKVLTGQQVSLIEGKTQFVYVRDSGVSGRVIQLVPWRDGVLALDNEGRIWWLQSGYGLSDIFGKVSLAAMSPLGR